MTRYLKFTHTDHRLLHFSLGSTWLNHCICQKSNYAFESLFPEGNTREVQPLNGRLILTDVPGFAQPWLATDALGSLVPGVNIEGLPLTADVSNVAAAVPEPETYAMLLAGLGLIGFAVRRGKYQDRGLDLPV